MATNKTLSWFDRLLENPKKMLMLAIVIVIAVLLIWWLSSKLKNVIKAGGNSVIGNVDLATYMTQSGEKLSYAEEEYDNMANTLYRAMKGAGTDEDAIYRVFNRMNNTADLKKLKLAFGTRDDMTLGEWLEDDLSTSEINKVNNILSTKGITMLF